MRMTWGAIVVLLPAMLAAQTWKPRVDFQRDVKPLLQRRCVACHNDTNSASNLSLTSRQSVVERHSIVPGKPGESVLFRMVKNRLMPPPEAGKPLTAAEIETLRRWIEQGAAW